MCGWNKKACFHFPRKKQNFAALCPFWRNFVKFIFQFSSKYFLFRGKHPTTYIFAKSAYSKRTEGQTKNRPLLSLSYSLYLQVISQFLIHFFYSRERASFGLLHSLTSLNEEEYPKNYSKFSECFKSHVWSSARTMWNLIYMPCKCLYVVK